MNRPCEPILVADRFPAMRSALIDILEHLPADAWERETVCTGWSVKDVALHILGDDMSVLSRRRDGHSEREEFDGWQDLVDWINLRNDQWVVATRRLSTTLLIQMLAVTGELINFFFSSLDPDASGKPVDWAGDGPAPLWLEIAREYTEYWMHHQHICDAIEYSSLKTPEFFHPLLATFMYGVPHTYSQVQAHPGTVVQISITGDSGSTWYLLYEDDMWQLYAEVDAEPVARIQIPQESAWRLFTKGIGQKEAYEQSQTDGDPELVEPFFDTVSIIA